jgi:hypothetical protein
MYAVSFRLLALLSCLLCGLSTLPAAQAIDEHSIYRESALWPPRSALTSDFTSADTDAPRTLPAGREAVLIRLEPGDPVHVVLDFGRLGLHHVPLAQTDVLHRARQLAAGETVKDTPNWTMMIGRGFSRVREVPQKIPLQELNDFRNLLIVYLTDEPESIKAALERVHVLQDLLEATATFPVVFVDEKIARRGESGTIRKLIDNGLGELPFMAPHVSAPYARSMAHGIQARPSWVLTDVEGKTLYHPGPDQGDLPAMEAGLTAVLDKLPGRRAAATKNSD